MKKSNKAVRIPEANNLKTPIMYNAIKSMSKSNATTLVSFSIWIVAMLINGIGDMAYIAITQGGGGEWLEPFGFILLFSAIFSLPGIIIFWIVFLFNNENKNLFGILMITAVVTPAVSVMLLLLSFGGGLNREFIGFTVIAVLSALASTVIHCNAINTKLNKE